MNTSELPIKYWQLPNIDDILTKGFIKNSNILDQERVSTIESTLISFGVLGKIVEVMYGPTTTWFGVELSRVQERNSASVRTSFKKINDLSVDLAVALAVSYVQ